MASETAVLSGALLRDAIHRKAKAIFGNMELNSRIQQDREFHKQFVLAPGVDLYPKKKRKTDPDKCATGLIGHLAEVAIHILPEEEALVYFQVRCDYD